MGESTKCDECSLLADGVHELILLVGCVSERWEQLRLTLNVTTGRLGSMARYVMKVSYLSDEPSETQASQGQNVVPEVVLVRQNAHTLFLDN